MGDVPGRGKSHRKDCQVGTHPLCSTRKASSLQEPSWGGREKKGLGHRGCGRRSHRAMQKLWFLFREKREPFFPPTALLRCNLHTITSTHCERSSPWFLVNYNHCRAPVLHCFYPRKILPGPSAVSPQPHRQPQAATNLFSVSIDSFASSGHFM